MTPEISSRLEALERTLLSDTPAQKQIDAHANGAPRVDVSGLNLLALRSLVSLFNEKEQLFSGRVTLTGKGLCRDAVSRKRSMIAYLGLHRLREPGENQPFDLASIREVVLRDTGWVKNAGDLGLLTWFAAVSAPDRLETIFKEFDFERALKFYPDGRQARTRGPAWLLAGIAHARLANPELFPDLTDLAVDAYHMLLDNQSENGIFGHGALSDFPHSVVHGRVGTFSDQIYAIYALSLFARAFHIEEPLEAALGCANAICALQGEMGQWWFLYDKRTSRVVNRYPVFSAHQDGTAPCALLALEEASGRSFQNSIFKGLSWISGANELGVDLRNPGQTLVWDSIGTEGRMAQYWEAALNYLNIPRVSHVESLKVRYEARPDHFGWLLYAFGKFGLPKPAIAAVAGR